MPELVKSWRSLKLVDVCSPLDLPKYNQPRSAIKGPVETRR